MSLFPNFQRFSQQMKAIAKWAEEQARRKRNSGGAGNVGRGSGSGGQLSRGSGRGSSVGNWLWNAILSKLGAAGQVIAALLRPSGKQPANLQKELEEAQELLEAFGYTITPPGPAGLPDAMGLEAQGRVELVEERPTLQQAREKRSGVLNPTDSPDVQEQVQEPGFVAPASPTSEDVMPASTLIEGMIPVKSSNVHSIGFEWNPYDSRLPGNLLVRFLGGDGKQRSGPGPLYRYKDVPREIFTRFKMAASKGGFVWDELRVRGSMIAHQYDYDLAGTGPDGYIPRQVGNKRGEKGVYYLERVHGGKRSSKPTRLAAGSRGKLPGPDIKKLKLKAGRRDSGRT